MPRKPMSESDWIRKAQAIHGNDYNYDSLGWISRNHPVSIICNNCETRFVHSTGKEHIRSPPRSLGCPIKCRDEGMARIKDDEILSVELDEESSGIVKSWNWEVHPKWLTTETNHKLNWICSQCNHSWRSVRFGGRSCPACAGKEICNFDEWNSAENVFPYLVKFWAEENELQPSQVPFGSGKKFQFLCIESSCDRVHESKLNNKVRRWYCPYCRGDGRIRGQSVWENYPEMIDYLNDKSQKDEFYPCTSDHVLDWECKSCNTVYSNKINWQVYRKKRELCVPCTQKWVLENRPTMALTFENFVEKAISIHGETYSYSKDSYTKSSSKLEMTHLICGITETRLGNSHLQGAGCTKCADYGFSRQAPADYYVHAIIQEGNNEIIAYKAGIAGDWRQRIQTLRRHLPDGLRIANLSSIRFSLGQDAWDFEQSLLKIGSIRHKVLDFQGGTELFNINPLDYAKSINLI